MSSTFNRRLRIAFVADSFHANGAGGIVTAWRFVEKLREKHDVILVGTDADGPGKVPVLDLPIQAMHDMGFIMARPDRDVLASVFADVDVVHLQMPFWLSFTALSEARRAGKPVVTGFHVQPENALLNVGVRSEWLNRLFYWGWVRGLYERADAVVAPTEFAARKLREHGLTRPTYVVSNGIRPASERPRFERGPADGKFRILAVGRLAAEKHQDTLIEAVRRSRHREDIELVIAGRGPMEESLRDHASVLPGAKVGFVPQEDLWRLLDTSDLFVHCSEVELEGMSVLEAMGAGLPALVAQGPQTAASDLALDDRFRFPVMDVAALTVRLDALIESPAELRAAGEEYRRRAGALDFDRCVDKLARVYGAVVNGLGPVSRHPPLEAMRAT